MTERPDCFKCRYRGNVPGSSHLSCHHPVYDDPQIKFLSLLSAAGQMPGIKITVPGIIVKGNPVGIERGWFTHPVDFDPTWLEECSGFVDKSESIKEK
jgi:hypothetical protein